jgi:hypothetical protein
VFWDGTHFISYKYCHSEILFAHQGLSLASSKIKSRCLCGLIAFYRLWERMYFYLNASCWQIPVPCRKTEVPFLCWHDKGYAVCRGPGWVTAPFILELNYLIKSVYFIFHSSLTSPTASSLSCLFCFFFSYFSCSTGIWIQGFNVLYFLTQAFAFSYFSDWLNDFYLKQPWTVIMLPTCPM